MTAHLKKIMEDLDRLSEEEQNLFAFLIGEELAWKEAFNKPNPVLSRLAKEALKEFRNRESADGTLLP